MKRCLLMISVALIVGLTIPSARWALAQPSEVAYQGELKEKGTRITRTVQMKFAIVAGCSGPGCQTLWSNDSTSVGGSEPTSAVDVPVLNGLFTVYLGAPPMKPLSADVFSEVAGDSLRVWVKSTRAFEQLSDQRIASVPFALRCEAPIAGDTTWRTSAADIFRPSGRVGIGKNTPTATLDVLGGDDASGDYVLRIADKIHGNALFIGTDANLSDFMRIRPSTGSGVAITNHGDKIGVFVAAATGNVGIGTTIPARALDVGGYSRLYWDGDGGRLDLLDARTNNARVRSWADASTIGHISVNDGNNRLVSIDGDGQMTFQ